ncbi:unnamed protein product [Paramecium pentaurelia]|uniref:Uncharacterized protein n=1 Tax=Paramecium pentaurelia TaxID=43138 RepID=A0A8S1WLD6_9CILI|nr:unnamed protein product [Paramecium pentaurelia]
MMQAKTYHKLDLGFPFQIQQFQLNKQFHHKIQYQLHNCQEKCIDMYTKMSLNQQQQFQMTMYLENINPQKNNTRFKALDYNNILLKDIASYIICTFKSGWNIKFPTIKIIDKVCVQNFPLLIRNINQSNKDEDY